MSEALKGDTMPRKYPVDSKYKNPDYFISRLKKKIGQRWITETMYLARVITAGKRHGLEVGDTVIIECVVERIEPLPDFEFRLTLRQKEVRLVL